MKQTLLSLAVIFFGLGSAFGQTTLDLELNGTSSDLDPFMFEVQLAFDVLPDSMGTGNEMGSGWQQYEPNYTFTMFPVGTLTTEYYWEESITNLSMYVAVICGEDTTILPPIDFESNTPTDIVYAVSVDVGCGDGDVEWDCPNLMGNVGWGCQGGWGIIDENCDCVEYIEPENCLEFYLPGTDSTLFDPSSLLMYALMECGNQDNPEPWIFCGLAESISEAMAGDEDACNEVAGWILANDWDGTWDPGNGGNDFDCPDLIGNIGDPCGIDQGTFGVINEDCECIEVSDCDVVVQTNLLSIDDGTGSGSVEAIASGGTPPFVYIWTDFWDEQFLIEVDTLGGTGTTLDSVPAGTYFLQVTDANGCVAFGWEDVPTAWDCPELEANVGDFCGNGGMLQIVSEDCECVDYEEPNSCVADFTVVQAYNENEVIPFELFVFIWGYDESNSYSWDFGDEGTSSDPFPSWTYGGSGPYNLCLTVSNEEEDCVSTSCQMLEIDSLGWINGFMDGFSITIMNGEDGVVNGIDEQPANELGFNVVPNPVVNGSFGLNWEASSTGLVEITMLSMDGSVVVQTTRNPGETSDAQSINVANLAPGLYFCQVRQNGLVRTEKVVIR
ncbi:MAG: hypothetical protein CL834_04265 [Crocinitomicaceae bacterium]|nr:hypothetical protein [Crocinitomicaceae bacterium]